MSQRRFYTEGVCLGYDDAKVIQDVSFEILEGKVTALIGRNGCGKSTLLKALARLIKPTVGHVYLDGKSIQEHTTKEVAKQVGLLPQGAVTPEQWTVFDLVAQGRFPHQGFLNQWSIEDETAVTASLEMTRMSELADRRVDSLSGGQRQRAWIAMALAQETSILLLDEPTTYLDINYKLEVLETLAKLNRETGRTIVMVVHDLNEAARYAHRVLALRQGVVYAEGPPQEVICEQMVNDVFGVDCRILDDPIAGRVAVAVPGAATEVPGSNDTVSV
jgi:iron complex transport system ATP-binding protein